MSRRSFPRIDPAALRDHADEARVDRVWERVEHDLASRSGGSYRDARARRSTFVYLAAAAAFGAFGAGLWAGKATWDRKPPTVETVATPALDKSLVELVAAGSHAREHKLEGGGRLMLVPGTMVEIERAATGSALTISLLQGEAAVHAMGRKNLSVVAGDARINTQAGAVLSVRRNVSDIDVNVSDGEVTLSSPSGTQQLRKDERAAGVPMHAPVASAPIDAAPRRGVALPARRSLPNARPHAKGAAQPEWLQRYQTDEEGAFALLQKQGVSEAIDKARSATELMALADIVRHRGRDPGASVRAYKRVVDAFPGDQNAYTAAIHLAEFYERSGEVAMAQLYRERVKLQATMQDAFMCNEINMERDKTRAAERGSEYLRKYPNGQCAERVREMLQGDDAPPAVDAPVAPATAAPVLPPLAPIVPPAPTTAPRAP